MPSRFLPALLACLALLLSLGCAATDETAAHRTMTADERRLHQESFDKVWETVRDKHWDPELGGIDWEGVKAELQPKLDAARDANEVRRVLNAMVGKLGESHFGISPGSRAAKRSGPPVGDGAGGARAEGGDSDDSAAGEVADEDRTEDDIEEEPGSLVAGLDLRLLGDEAVVTEVDPGSPAEKAGVKLGWKVIAVNGRKVGDVLDLIRDRFTGSMRELYLTRIVASRFSGDPGDTVRAVFEDGSGKEVDLELGVAKSRGKLFKFGHMGSSRVWFESRRLTGDIGYLRFNAFMDPANIMREFQVAMEGFMDCKGIVIDIRGNPGGIGIMASGVASWFLDDSGQILGTMKTRDSTIKFAVFPRVETFGGPVAVLQDGLSASTSEIFSGGMKDLGRVRIFGTTTAGAALPSVFELLPNGDRFQYAIADCWSTSGYRMEGKGVVPHQEVRHDRALLLKGRDAMLEAATAWIESRRKKDSKTE